MGNKRVILEQHVLMVGRSFWTPLWRRAVLSVYYIAGMDILACLELSVGIQNQKR